ncbi:hypothetical protein PGRAN_02730 [Listeria grandensis FSL F6-0971]|uniref:Uncharacterized protein n=1 Tax=Listeria grandensis FSL F6-0971 TaxID=1265819 RepID=W7BWW5_9LIST|nr:hypothetical protein [Listeria grandensis]EUJ24773.1 hypothetical protein PGRAN_02730 [Listeria grandensis FSL F6-0971]
MTTDNYSKMLPDMYDKAPESNISKLLQIYADDIETLRAIAEKVEAYRDIDQAVGKTLDYAGNNINQQRGKTSDEIYRVLIKAKETRIRCSGTIDDIIESLARALDCSYDQIQIYSDIDEGGTEPEALILKGLPLESLNKVAMSATQFTQLVQKVVPSEVRVSSVILDGTFSFASGSLVETSPQGFANTAGTTGGTLGGVFTPENDYILPI